MKKIKEENLDNISGGTTLNLSASLLNSFSKIVEVVFEIGVGFGSSMRRISENNVCPLK